MGGRNELVPGTLEMLVLEVLTDGPRHGYSIVRELCRTSEDVLRVEEGSLYPALHRMERRGWLAAAWGTSEACRRAKFYRVTSLGRKERERKRASWKRMSGAIEKVLRSRPQEG